MCQESFFSTKNSGERCFSFLNKVLKRSSRGENLLRGKSWHVGLMKTMMMELLVLLYKFYRAQRTTQANGRIYLALLSVVVQQLLEKLSSLKPLILLKLGFTKRGALLSRLSCANSALKYFLKRCSKISLGINLVYVHYLKI